VIQAYLGYNITAIQTQLMSIASLIKERQGKCICNSSTRCITKAILHPRMNEHDHISKEVHNNVSRQVKVSVDPILYRSTVKIHLPVKFLFIP
jgi:hypothetical protein